jgi:hypothetical protein
MAESVSRTTTDHETIRRWVEERGGWPAEVEATAGRDVTGIIRIDFPGYSGEGRLRRISWDEWFGKFDESELAFVYEESTARGERSSFNKLVARETAAARAEGRRTSRRGGGRRGSRPAGDRGASRGGRSAGRGTSTRGGATRTKAKRATARRAPTRGGGRRRTTRAEAARTASRGGAKRGAARRGKTSRRGKSRRGGR